MTRGSPSSYAMLSCQVGSDTDIPCTEWAGIDAPSAVGIRALVTVAGIDQVSQGSSSLNFDDSDVKSDGTIHPQSGYVTDLNIPNSGQVDDLQEKRDDEKREEGD